MKLNKVLALALSGIMAVSMLAGCSGKTDDGKEEQTPATVQIAADVNKALSEANQKKITFTDDGDLESKLSTAINLNGVVTLPKAEAVESSVQKLTGITNNYTAMTSNTLNKGYTTVHVRKYNATSTKLSAAVQNFVKNEVDTWVASMPAYSTNPDWIAEGTTYISYSYTGSVAVVEASNVDNTGSAYYFVTTITQTPTVMTKTAD